MIAVNPVLAREMRSRMRGRRAAVLLTFWLAFNGAVLAVVYLAAQNVAEQQFGFGDFANTYAIGRGIFEWTLSAMLALMLLIVPAQAAGAIAGERERQTLVPLQVTLLSPWRILVGKIGASVAFLVLLIVAGMPLLAVGYMVGGLDVGDLAVGAGAVLVSGLLVAALCIAISTFSRRVQGATVLCYALVLALSIGTLLAYGAWTVVDQSRGSDRADPPAALLLVNPVAFVSDIVGDDEITDLPSPFDGIHTIVNRDPTRNDFVAVGGGIAFDNMGRPMNIDPFVGVQGPQVLREPSDDDGIPFWALSLLALSSAAVCAVSLAAWRLRTPAETER